MRDTAQLLWMVNPFVPRAFFSSIKRRRRSARSEAEENAPADAQGLSRAEQKNVLSAFFLGRSSLQPPLAAARARAAGSPSCSIGAVVSAKIRSGSCLGFAPARFDSRVFAPGRAPRGPMQARDAPRNPLRLSRLLLGLGRIGLQLFEYIQETRPRVSVVIARRAERSAFGDFLLAAKLNIRASAALLIIRVRPARFPSSRRYFRRRRWPRRHRRGEAGRKRHSRPPRSNSRLAGARLGCSTPPSSGARCLTECNPRICSRFCTRGRARGGGLVRRRADDVGCRRVASRRSRPGDRADPSAGRLLHRRAQSRASSNTRSRRC